MTEEREESGDGRERPSTAADRRGRRPAPAAAGGGQGPRHRGARRPPDHGSRCRSGWCASSARSSPSCRKVIWPTRKQLVTYTLVVLVFVSFMVALVALLDFRVGQGVNALFGA